MRKINKKMLVSIIGICSVCVIAMGNMNSNKVKAKSNEKVVYEEYTSKNESKKTERIAEATLTPIDEIVIRNGLHKINGVWGYYKNNVLQTKFNGLQTNKNGTFVVEKGLVNFKINGLKKVDGVWYYVKKGKVILDAYGLAKNKNGLWLVENGKVNFKVSGLKRVKGEWYYFEGGEVQTDYTGIKTNKNGTWLVEDGEIDFEYKGTYVTTGSITNPKKGQKRYYVNKNKVDKKRSAIITQALIYLNTPYVYGGTSLKKGIDCSAFTKAIYAKAAISLERTAASQAMDKRGKSVSLAKAKPGDLIFYSRSRNSAINHVGIYMGNGKIVHAGYSKKKVMVANVDLGMTIKCVKSYIN